MFASNFPVDKLYSDFDTLYAAFAKSLHPLAPRNVGCCFTITPHITTGFGRFGTTPESKLRTFCL
jgi:hypothetical protein